MDEEVPVIVLVTILTGLGILSFTLSLLAFHCTQRAHVQTNRRLKVLEKDLNTTITIIELMVLAETRKSASQSTTTEPTHDTDTRNRRSQSLSPNPPSGPSSRGSSPHSHPPPTLSLSGATLVNKSSSDSSPSSTPPYPSSLSSGASSAHLDSPPSNPARSNITLVEKDSSDSETAPLLSWKASRGPSRSGVDALSEATTEPRDVERGRDEEGEAMERCLRWWRKRRGAEGSSVD
ncbi:hypothetical protein IQ07DRAFT_651993 [Pyrenochaeta sp. DS3sAY3a]|nr:hypothetical protein IQ07DRAFT_651993 [Pyrenochaeta sp. DS3sAY3a]